MENTTHSNTEKITEEATSVIEHEKLETLKRHRNFKTTKNEVWNR